jgi:hypothetical protein
MDYILYKYKKDLKNARINYNKDYSNILELLYNYVENNLKSVKLKNYEYEPIYMKKLICIDNTIYQFHAFFIEFYVINKHKLIGVNYYKYLIDGIIRRELYKNDLDDYSCVIEYLYNHIKKYYKDIQLKPYFYMKINVEKFIFINSSYISLEHYFINKYVINNNLDFCLSIVLYNFLLDYLY